MKKTFLLLLVHLSATLVFAQAKLTMDSSGNKLRQFYLKQNVESLWIAGHHVNWETGEPDNPTAAKSIRTHCSAFVAAVCKQEYIYILRPPQHVQSLLANAQYDWLFTGKAHTKGWRQIQNNVFITAQQFTNTGFIVVAVAKNADASEPGHIAFVMPGDTDTNILNNEGPILIQASTVNSESTLFRRAFRRHITQWPPTAAEVAFFYNVNRIK